MLIQVMFSKTWDMRICSRAGDRDIKTSRMTGWGRQHWQRLAAAGSRFQGVVILISMMYMRLCLA
jgi:hypothetical protein